MVRLIESPKFKFSDAQRRFIAGPMEFMRTSTAPFYDMTPVSAENNRGLYETRNWVNSKQFFVQSKNDAVIIRRTKAQAENGAGLLFVNRYFGGSLRGRLSDVNLDRDPGAIYVFDLSTQVEVIQFPVLVQGFFIPKAELGFNPDIHAPLTGFSQDHPLGRVLYRQFDLLFDSLIKNNEFSIAHFDRLIACLKVGLGTDDQSQGDVRRQARDAIAGQIFEFIEQNLHQPELSVSLILKRFGVSRASLYRIFEKRGGVRQYISNRRLFRAVFEISGEPHQRGIINAAAEKWGFSSGANFNRAVRNQFGVAPGSLINTIGTDEGYKNAGRIVDQFAKQAA